MNAKLHARLQSQIHKLDSISTAPAILKPLLDMLRLPSEKIKVEKVVELISYDGSIAAQCLRLANSPLFGRRETETVRSAVMALGLERIRSMLFGLCLNRVIPQDKWVMEPDAFWRRSAALWSRKEWHRKSSILSPKKLIWLGCCTTSGCW